MRVCARVCVLHGVGRVQASRVCLHHSTFICFGVDSATFSCRLNTDIAFGNKFGMKTLCVLSGTTQRADLSAAEGIMRPHYVAPSIASGRKQ